MTCALYKVIFHTTLALILDGCNSTFGPPVDASRKRINANILVSKSGRNLHWARFEALVSLGRPELSISEVGELVERLNEFDSANLRFLAALNDSMNLTLALNTSKRCAFSASSL